MSSDAASSAGAGESAAARCLGDAWPAVPDPLAWLFGAQGRLVLVGFLRFRSGDNLSRWACALLGVPRAGDAPSRVVVARRGDGETWVRELGTWTLVTEGSVDDDVLVERLGALELRFRLSLAAGEVRHDQVGAALLVLGRRFALRGRRAPTVVARTRAGRVRDGVHAEVEVRWPGERLLFAYAGELRPPTGAAP